MLIRTQSEIKYPETVPKWYIEFSVPAEIFSVSVIEKDGNISDQTQFCLILWIFLLLIELYIKETIPSYTAIISVLCEITKDGGSCFQALCFS